MIGEADYRADVAPALAEETPFLCLGVQPVHANHLVAVGRRNHRRTVAEGEMRHGFARFAQRRELLQVLA